MRRGPDRANSQLKRPAVVEIVQASADQDLLGTWARVRFVTEIPASASGSFTKTESRRRLVRRALAARETVIRDTKTLPGGLSSWHSPVCSVTRTSVGQEARLKSKTPSCPPPQRETRGPLAINQQATKRRAAGSSGLTIPSILRARVVMQWPNCRSCRLVVLLHLHSETTNMGATRLTEAITAF